MQEEEETLFPISYISNKLIKAEQNYSTLKKECLADSMGHQKIQKLYSWYRIYH